MAFDIEKALPILRKGWHQPYGLLTAILVDVSLGIAFIAAANPSFAIAASIISGSIPLIVIAWFWSRKLPTVRKGKVGFAVSLWCSDEEAQIKVREDFVLSLRKLIKSGRTGQSFHFIEIPAYKAEKIVDNDDAQALRLKIKAHFMIFGRVRSRHIDRSDRYFLELDGIVSHKPIADDISQRLANEFSELLPRKVFLAKENDLLSFQFASEWADIVAKYIIGIAAAVSGDLQYAEELYSDARTRVQQTNSDFPIFVKLKNRIPQRLAELFEARALNCYEIWAKGHDISYIVKLGEFLKQYEVEAGEQKTPSILTLFSIYYFLSDRDIKKAEEYLNQIPKQARGATWHFNQAFLSAYQKDLRRSIRHYRKGMNFPITPDLISKIEDFLCSIAAEEPSKIQLHYCLGFFNWKIKGDFLQAENDFKNFLSADAKNGFIKEMELASGWLNEIVDMNKDSG